MKWKFGGREGDIYGHAAACAVGVPPLPEYQREGEGGGRESSSFTESRSRSGRENIEKSGFLHVLRIYWTL